jgi:excisionase family DNA binding protein
MTTQTQSAVALEHLEKLHPVRAYSVPQICELAGVGRTHLYAQIKEGKLKALKCGRRTIVLDEELRRWLSGCRGTGLRWASLCRPAMKSPDRWPRARGPPGRAFIQQEHVCTRTRRVLRRRMEPYSL